MLWEAIKLALKTIRRNVLRSFLTLLGVVIGVGAVIAMVSIGNSTTQQVMADISKLGTNMISIHPGKGQRGPGGPPGGAAQSFDIDDSDAIQDQVNDAVAVAPAVMVDVNAIYRNESLNSFVWGTNNDYFIIRRWSFARGRRFFPAELRASKSVCVIGHTVWEKLFGTEPPIGRKIRLRKLSCEIIGLLAEKGQSSIGGDQDDLIVMPLRTVQRRLAGNQDIDEIFVSARSDTLIDKVRKDVVRLMRERRRISPEDEDDFHVRDMKELIKMQTTTIDMFTGLLSAVAGVSLLVGGIGIMNIMLVSVTERTREIGIRLAIGAFENQVLAQFLIEAVILSLIGGFIGMLVGFGLALLIMLLVNVPIVFDLNIVLIAFTFSVAVGMIFGYFPARRAARLDPIEALRHE